ncbi:MAG: ABC transporter permease, partial [Actinobacteria bacterium]|nr:ABC transporter permease [Actinomycetota bacterium]
MAEYSQARELAVNLTLRELRGRYKRSVLGWTWSLLNPLASVVIYSIVFSFFLKIEPPVGEPSGLHSFVLFLLCGLLPWNFLSSGANAAMGALVGNGNLIKKVYFPREILVGSAVAAHVITLLIELGVLVVVFLIGG